MKVFGICYIVFGLMAVTGAVLDADDWEVSRDANFTEDLDADSLDIAFLVMDAEKEFGISIPDADAEKIHTFGEAVDYINRFPEYYDNGKE